MKVKSNLLVELRQQRYWSQNQLAEISGLSARTIQRIEATGNASLESVKALAATLEIAADELVAQAPVSAPRPKTKNAIFRIPASVALILSLAGASPSAINASESTIQATSMATLGNGTSVFKGDVYVQMPDHWLNALAADQSWRIGQTQIVEGNVSIALPNGGQLSFNKAVVVLEERRLHIKTDYALLVPSELD